MRRLHQFPAAERLQTGRGGNQPAGLVLSLYEEDVRLAGRGLSAHYSKTKLSTGSSVNERLGSPTLKIKRHAIEERYLRMADAWLPRCQKVIWE